MNEEADISRCHKIETPQVPLMICQDMRHVLTEFRGLALVDCSVLSLQIGRFQYSTVLCFIHFLLGPIPVHNYAFQCEHHLSGNIVMWAKTEHGTGWQYSKPSFTSNLIH